MWVKLTSSEMRKKLSKLKKKNFLKCSSRYSTWGRSSLPLKCNNLAVALVDILLEGEVRLPMKWSYLQKCSFASDLRRKSTLITIIIITFNNLKPILGGCTFDFLCKLINNFNWLINWFKLWNSTPIENHDWSYFSKIVSYKS